MSTIERAPLYAIPLRTIDAGQWGRVIQRWNAMHRDRRREMVAAAAECRRTGHDLVVCPVGPFCRRCCSYFRGGDE